MTPELSLEGVEPNAVALEFDSSYRPYPSMQGLVDVSFDGGDSWENLQIFNEETVDGGQSSLTRANSTETFDINNPRGGTVMFRWGIINAGNDWWWAIDNVRVTTEFTGNPLPGLDDSSLWQFSTASEAVVDDGGLAASDLDDDGVVNVRDFLILSRSFNTTVEPGTGADIDGDGQVNVRDFLVLSRNFNKVVSAAAVDAVFA